MNTCSIEGCERDATTDDVCEFHHAHLLNIEKDRISKLNSQELRAKAPYAVTLTYEGVTKTKARWAEEIGMSLAAFNKRLKNWPLEKAVTHPVDTKKSTRIK